MLKRASAAAALLALCAAVLPAETGALTSFQELYQALIRGEAVRAVFHYKRCRLISENRIIEDVPDAVGGMPLDVFEYFAPGSIGNRTGYIASSQRRLIHHPRHGYVDNYVKINIFSDGRVRITARYLSPKDLSVVMDESFDTTINDGSRGGACFYVVR